MRQFLIFICKASELLCSLKDKSDYLCAVEYLLTKQTCILAGFSNWLDEKYKLGVWKITKKTN